MTAATHWYCMTRIASCATARTRSHVHAPSRPAGARMAARDVPVLYWCYCTRSQSPSPCAPLISRFPYFLGPAVITPDSSPPRTPWARGQGPRQPLKMAPLRETWRSLRAAPTLAGVVRMLIWLCAQLAACWLVKSSKETARPHVIFQFHQGSGEVMDKLIDALSRWRGLTGQRYGTDFTSQR
jgi:hypothetical protein